MTDNYDGPERRATERRGCATGDTFCDDHLHRVVQDKIAACKTDISQDMHEIRASISKIEHKQDALTTDVHKLGLSVRDIAINSASIAASLQSMSGLVQTYQMFVGINNFMIWMRKNIITLAVISVLFMYASGKIDMDKLLGWIL